MLRWDIVGMISEIISYISVHILYIYIYTYIITYRYIYIYVHIYIYVYIYIHNTYIVSMMFPFHSTTWNHNMFMAKAGLSLPGGF